MQVDAQFLTEHVAYSRWATLKTLDACEKLHRDELDRYLYTSFRSVFGTLVHIYRADGVWLQRLKGNPLATMPAPASDSGVAGLRASWLPILDEYVKLTSQLKPEEIEAPVAFRSTVSGDRTLLLWQVVLHVVNHATYHRGQITTLLRQLAHDGVSTDMSAYWADHVTA